MLRLSLLALSLSLLILSYALGESESIDEIVVTASRRPQKVAETPSNISVLRSEDLAKLPVHDLAEALGAISGVDVQGRGSFGQPSSLSLQGADPAHTRIMVDGVLLNTQGTAFANPSLIPVGNIERIEVVKGPGSALWGSSLGGLINVITKSPPETGSPIPKGNLTFSAGAGDINLWQQTLELSGRAGKLGYVFYNNHTDTQGDFRKNSSFFNNNLFTKINYELNPLMSLTGSYNYTHQAIGGYEFDTLGYGEDYGYLVRYGTFGASYNLFDIFRLDATLKSSNQDAALTRFAVPGSALIGSSKSNDVFNGLDVVGSYKLAVRQTVTGGLDLGQDRLNSDQMARPEQASRYGVYGEYRHPVLAHLDITAGARYDDNTAYGAQFSPSAGAVYALPKDTDVKLSVSRAFNAPPLIYKYISGNPFLTANNDLKAERGVAYQVSVEGKPTPGLSAKVGLYRAEIEDLVRFVEISPFLYQAQNSARARRQGLETEIKYMLIGHSEPFVSCHSERSEESRSAQDKLREESQPPDSSPRLPSGFRMTNNDIGHTLMIKAGFEFNRVQDRVTGQLIKDNGIAKAAYHLGMDYQYGKSLQAGLLGNYNFWNEPPASRSLDRRFIWDARLSYELAKQPVSVFANLYNIFNRQYYYNVLLPSPGRRIEVGLRYGF
ncbi:MAG: TonB-dependent receptor [Planctomycetes bacterium]|nr:TonB-dependent receptor [Planctomycetota bacterium]